MRWRQTWDLSRREFLERARSRAFIVLMLFTVGMILALIPFFAFAFQDPDPIRIGITPDAPAGTERALVQRGDELDQVVEVTAFPGRDEAETALREGEVDAVFTGSSIVWLDEESSTISAIVSGAALAARFQEAAAELGLTAAELASLLTPPDLDGEFLEPPDPEEGPRRVAAFFGLFLLYMSILIFGQFVAMGVTEEKQNRVVEVVLARVEPWQVLIGKVVGIGALGLIQLVAIGVAGIVAVSLVDLADVSLQSIGISVFVSIVFWFLLGYALYAVLYAAMGATVSRQEDLQGTVMLPVILLLPGFFIAQFAQDFPDSPLVVGSSLFPLWSPMVMPVRSTIADVPWWQLLAAIALILVAAYLVVRWGARVYRGAVLRVGAKVRLRDAWRLSQ